MISFDYKKSVHDSQKNVNVLSLGGRTKVLLMFNIRRRLSLDFPSAGGKSKKKKNAGPFTKVLNSSTLYELFTIFNSLQRKLMKP